MQTDAENQENWYAIQVKARAEHSTQQLLLFKGYDVFLPLSSALRYDSEKVRPRIMPLFPGYLFLHESTGAAGLVVTTPGVIRIVGTRGHPTPIDPVEIERIQIAARSGMDLASHSYLSVGEQAEIHTGVLAGVKGIMLAHFVPKRILLSVSVIGASIVVKLDPLVA